MLPPYVRDSLEDKSMLVHFKKALPLTSLGTHLKEELLTLKTLWPLFMDGVQLPQG